eukprot:COSAG06_NODE_19800_length_822_cov_1.000000_1_plen_20_part_10
MHFLTNSSPKQAATAGDMES